MPYVKPIPVGQNVAAVLGVLGRTRSLEAQRGNGEPAISWPLAWSQAPTQTALIGTSGAAWVMYAGQNQLLIDGVAGPTGNAIASGNGLPTAVGVTGLTPGWHIFELALFGPGGNFSGNFLIVWPI